ENAVISASNSIITSSFLNEKEISHGWGQWQGCRRSFDLGPVPWLSVVPRKVMWTNVFALVAANPEPGMPHDGTLVWALVIAIAVAMGIVWAFIGISNRKEKKYRERRTHEVD